jgi:hypothetical protein
MVRSTTPRAALGPLALIALLAVLLLSYRPPARPRLAPPWAINMPGEWSEVADIELSGLGVTVDEFSQQTDMQIISAEGLYAAEDQAQLATETEWALAYVSDRFGHTPAQPVSIDVQHDTGCQLNGAAYTEQRLVQVLTCPEIARNRVVNILAHELVHQLAHDRYGDAHLQADMILLEGLATWGAGDYWLSG